MKVAAVTITYNRLELTKQTIDSFYAKTSVDYHLFIDNGSTDGTAEFLTGCDHILLEKNYGIAYAFRMAVGQLKGYDYILKLDNDIETVTPDIINLMLSFYHLNGDKYVCSPVDLNIDKAYYPQIISNANLNGFNVQFTTHTGGAFQLIPYSVCQTLCNEFRHLKQGDYAIGNYFHRQGYKPTYMMDLQMKHIGLNQTSPNYIL
jgi:GT2 family glycosyltransferase